MISCWGQGYFHEKYSLLYCGLCCINLRSLRVYSEGLSRHWPHLKMEIINPTLLGTPGTNSQEICLSNASFFYASPLSSPSNSLSFSPPPSTISSYSLFFSVSFSNRSPHQRLFSSFLFMTLDCTFVFMYLSNSPSEKKKCLVPDSIFDQSSCRANHNFFEVRNNTIIYL